MALVWQRLLLATEGGEHDTGAQAVAAELAQRLQLPLPLVLPLTSNPEYEAVAPELAARAEAQAATRLDAIRESMRQRAVDLQPMVRRGPEPYAEIVAEARAQAADLIIIRRRGKRGVLAQLLVGEMVTKVVLHAPCSLLIAPRAAHGPRQGLLLALDPLTPSPQLVSQAAQVAVLLDLPLHIVSVASDATRRPLADAAVAVAVHAARAQGARADGQARTGRAHDQVVAAAREQGADLIVVARRAEEPAAAAPSGQRPWIGGVAQKIIGLAECAVLVHVPPSRSEEP